MNDDEIRGWLGNRAANTTNRKAADAIESLLAEVAGLRAERGRVPVSWDECADWLDTGGVVWLHSDGRPTNYGADRFRSGSVLLAPPGAYRLLPPPNLVAAPSGMDGGGFLGAGADVPDGWPWRAMVGDYRPWVDGTRKRPNDAQTVQCRPPVKPAERAVVEVPLTKLVGRIIEGETEAVRWSEVDGAGPTWLDAGGRSHYFPDGTLDLATGLVRVYAEGDES